MDSLLAVLLALYSISLIGLCLYGAHRYLILFLFLRHRHQPPKPRGQFEELPRITVQLPMYNERHVAKRLITAVEKLDYPKDRLEIQILDDSTDETREITQAEAARLRQAGFQVYLQQRTDRSGYKAGALEEALKVAKGEFIYILDADFVPRPDALIALIQFFTDPRVGMVQSRWSHLNRHYSLLTRIQSLFLDAHFFLEQTARSRSGRFIHFNGTAGMWRRSCIDAAGGWEPDTLTEDLDLSLRAQLAGWKFLYVNDCTVPSELPVHMADFKAQQYRWTKGAVQNFKKLFLKVWRSKQPLKVKLEASMQLSCHFAYGLVLLLSLTLIPVILFAPNLTWLWTIQSAAFFLATLPVAIFFLFTAHHLYPRTWWRDVLYLPMILATGIGVSVNNTRAILDALFNFKSGFERTPKYGIASQKDRSSLLPQERDPESAKPKATSLCSPKVVLAVELTLTLSFLSFGIWAIVVGWWSTAPFMLLFALGFAYIAWPALRQTLHERQHPSPRKAPQRLDPNPDTGN